MAQTLVQGFRQDRQAPEARYAQYGEQLATLQRHPNSASVSQVVLRLIPQRERLPLQRALDEALQRQAEQEAHEQTGLQLHALQRKKAELEEEALQPVMQRIAAKRGAGNPLPAAIQRHLEQGLNHDLSRVRIHDDAEADKLSKNVNALAFTTGTDIFFQSGHFKPNTQSGLELLAHEVTHTVQQSQGRVGTGIDPDAGLEMEAQAMGKQLAVPFRAVNSSLHQRLAPFGGKVALQRLADPQRNPITLAKDGISTPKPGINKLGFIEYKEGANIRTGPAELVGSTVLLPQPLPPATKVFVSGTHPQKPEWLYVTAMLPGHEVRGYVQNFRITTTLPESSATLHFVKGGETLRRLALQIYKQDIRPGRDLRFYEQTVLYLTQNAGLGGATWGTAVVTLPDGRKEEQKSVLLKKDEFIWLPSPAFANTLSGKVPSGSITGGAVAQAKTATRHLDDILSSITESPKYLGKIGQEYKDAILGSLPQILGVTAAFIAAEGLSVALAATPTGVGQLAAAAIQLGLGAWGAVGAGEAIQAAMPYAKKWLMTAWQANGDAKQIALASENFLYMMVQIALAALALLGAKGSTGKGLKLAENVKVALPTVGAAVAVTPNGQRVVIPVFKPGSITITTIPKQNNIPVPPVNLIERNVQKTVGESAQEFQKRLSILIRGFGQDVLRVVEDLGLGSHAIDRHVSKTAAYLIQRANRGGVPAATSFRDLSTATKAVLENLRNNADEIAEYVANGTRATRPKAFRFDHDREIGYGVNAGKKNVTYGLMQSEIIIKISPDSPYGFIILTAMPVMR